MTITTNTQDIGPQTLAAIAALNGDEAARRAARRAESDALHARLDAGCKTLKSRGWTERNLDALLGGLFVEDAVEAVERHVGEVK